MPPISLLVELLPQTNSPRTPILIRNVEESFRHALDPLWTCWLWLNREYLFLPLSFVTLLTY
nr:hypothetical protein Q903MT_gene241 [Picea sitchensis]